MSLLSELSKQQRGYMHYSTSPTYGRTANPPGNGILRSFSFSATLQPLCSSHYAHDYAPRTTKRESRLVGHHGLWDDDGDDRRSAEEATSLPRAQSSECLLMFAEVPKIFGLPHLNSTLFKSRSLLLTCPNGRYPCPDDTFASQEVGRSTCPDRTAKYWKTV